MGLLEEENYGKGGGNVFEFPVSKLIQSFWKNSRKMRGNSFPLILVFDPTSAQVWMQKNQREISQNEVRKLPTPPTPLNYKDSFEDVIRCDENTNCADKSDEEDCRMIYMKENYKKTVAPFRKH